MFVQSFVLWTLFASAILVVGLILSTSSLTSDILSEDISSPISRTETNFWNTDVGRGGLFIRSTCPTGSNGFSCVSANSNSRSQIWESIASTTTSIHNHNSTSCLVSQDNLNSEESAEREGSTGFCESGGQNVQINEMAAGTTFIARTGVIGSRCLQSVK